MRLQRVNAGMRFAVVVAMLLFVGCSGAAVPTANHSSPGSGTSSSAESPRPYVRPLPTGNVSSPKPSPVSAGPLKWTAPVRVNHLPSFGGSSLNAVSCPSSTLCVAVDDAGNVATSSNPTGGASAWTVAKIDGTRPLVGVSCPTSTLCVAIDGAGNTIISTTPTAAATWTVTNVDGNHHLSAVSCTTNSLCAAVDRAGNVITSTDPTGGAAAWKATLLDGSRPLIAVTCLDSGFCVAAREVSATEGEVLTSTDPSGGAAAWISAIGGPLLTDVSCPTRDLCVGVEHIGSDQGESGVIYTFGTAPGLTTAVLSDERPVEPTAVSCPSITLCIAVDSFGEVLTSTHPTGATSAWTFTDAGSDAINDISCPSSTFCVGVTSAGGVITSTNPTGKQTAWRESNLIGSASLLAISCPSTGLCVAVGDGGNIVSSTNPTGGAATWRVTTVAAAGGLTGVSCPTETFCVVADFSTGNILTSTNPTGGATTWTSTKVAQTNALNAVSCPTVSFCVAIDSFGNAFVSDDPGGGSAVWKLAHIYGTSCAWTVLQAPPQCILSSVSCPTDTFCVVGDAFGDVLVSSNPNGGSAYWNKAHIGGGDCTVSETGAPCWLAGMSCPTTKLCVAADAGRIFTSNNPAGGAAAWRAFLMPNVTYFTGVSCPDARFCASLADDNGAGGQVATSTNPAGEIKAWTSSSSIGGHDVRGISCPSSALCAAVDVDGEVIVGTARA
jgi:hypothetical protein